MECQSVFLLVWFPFASTVKLWCYCWYELSWIASLAPCKFTRITNSWAFRMWAKVGCCKACLLAFQLECCSTYVLLVRFSKELLLSLSFDPPFRRWFINFLTCLMFQLIFLYHVHAIRSSFVYPRVWTHHCAHRILIFLLRTFATHIASSTR